MGWPFQFGCLNGSVKIGALEKNKNAESGLPGSPKRLTGMFKGLPGSGIEGNWWKIRCAGTFPYFSYKKRLIYDLFWDTLIMSQYMLLSGESILSLALSNSQTWPGMRYLWKLARSIVLVKWWLVGSCWNKKSPTGGAGFLPSTVWCPFLTPRTWGSSMELAIYFHTGGSIAIPAHPMGERLHIQTEKKKTFQLQSWPTLIIVQTNMIHQVDPSVMLWEPFQNGGWQCGTVWM